VQVLPILLQARTRCSVTSCGKVSLGYTFLHGAESPFEFGPSLCIIRCELRASRWAGRLGRPHTALALLLY